MSASAPILSLAALSGEEEAPESTTLCDPTRAEVSEPAVAVPLAEGALVFAEAWFVVVALASEGTMGRLGVGFKGELVAPHSLFQAAS